jgi:hypothetical protein
MVQIRLRWSSSVRVPESSACAIQLPASIAAAIPRAMMWFFCMASVSSCLLKIMLLRFVMDIAYLRHISPGFPLRMNSLQNVSGCGSD